MRLDHARNLHAGLPLALELGLGLLNKEQLVVLAGKLLEADQKVAQARLEPGNVRVQVKQAVDKLLNLLAVGAKKKYVSVQKRQKHTRKYKNTA